MRTSTTEDRKPPLSWPAVIWPHRQPWKGRNVMIRSSLGGALLGTCLVMLASAPSVAAAQDNVEVLRAISFSSDAKVRESVKEQCKIQTDVPRFIEAYSDRVQLVDGPLRTNGRVLDLTIIAARAAGWGYLSGGKWVTLEGVLTENGRKIGNFTAKRFTIGYLNFTACGAARRCSKALGKDIAKWLEDPQPDSNLGSL